MNPQHCYSAHWSAVPLNLLLLKIQTQLLFLQACVHLCQDRVLPNLLPLSCWPVLNDLWLLCPAESEVILSLFTLGGQRRGLSTFWVGCLDLSNIRLWAACWGSKVRPQGFEVLWVTTAWRQGQTILGRDLGPHVTVRGEGAACVRDGGAFGLLVTHQPVEEWGGMLCKVGWVKPGGRCSGWEGGRRSPDVQGLKWNALVSSKPPLFHLPFTLWLHVFCPSAVQVLVCCWLFSSCTMSCFLTCFGEAQSVFCCFFRCHLPNGELCPGVGFPPHQVALCCSCFSSTCQKNFLPILAALWQLLVQLISSSKSLGIVYAQMTFCFNVTFPHLSLLIEHSLFSFQVNQH